MSPTYSTPGPTETLRALPVIASGQPVSVLRRCWFATLSDDRQQRSTLIESSVRIGREWVRLVDLTLEQIEAVLGAVTPRYVVRWYEAGKTGIQAATFVEHRDAVAFAKGKRLYAGPAEIKSLGGAL